MYNALWQGFYSLPQGDKALVDKCKAKSRLGQTAPPAFNGGEGGVLFHIAGAFR